MNVVQVMLTLLLACPAQLLCSERLCVHKNFDTLVQQVLDREMLTSKEAREISLSFTGLQDTLRTRWEGADLFVYGSILNGLSAKTSDVDVYMRIPNYNASADKYIVEETAKLLEKQPEKYNDIDPKLHLIVPMMTFYDISMQRYIDLSFRSYSAVKNTKMIAYYLNLDKRHIPLASIIKLWCKIHGLTGKGLAPNYAIYLMVIFYLQQKKMSPTGFEIQGQLPPYIIDRWNLNFEEIPYTTENNQSLYELVGGFFKYYSEFNFKKDCVSPFVGRPIAKSAFENLTSIPKEFSMFKEKYQRGDDEPITLHTEMCIQGMFEHNKNTVRRVKSKHVLKFITKLKSAARMYDELPCDQFFKFILVKGENNQTIENKFAVHTEF